MHRSRRRRRRCGLVGGNLHADMISTRDDGSRFVLNVSGSQKVDASGLMVLFLFVF